MNAKKRWYELLLTGTVILHILAAGNIQTANAQYAYVQGEWEGYNNADYTPSGGGSTYYEYALAYSNADEETGVCTCRAITDAKAKVDYAVADADSYAYLTTNWTWSGPPEYAPAAI